MNWKKKLSVYVHFVKVKYWLVNMAEVESLINKVKLNITNKSTRQPFLFGVKYKNIAWKSNLTFLLSVLSSLKFSSAVLAAKVKHG